MSRAIVGASPFVAVAICCFAIVLLHRLIGMLISRYPHLGGFIEGEKISLFEHGEFIGANLKRALLCREEIMQGVRKSALTEDMDKIEKVYMERNGDISAIKNNNLPE